MKSKLLTIICAAGLLVPHSSEAAITTWDAAWAAVTDNTAILTLAGYNLFGGFNFNGSATTINNGSGGVGGTDVAFINVPQNGSGLSITTGVTVANSGFGFQSTAGSNSNVISAVGSPQTWATVLDRVIGDFDNSATITLSGLTVGYEYYIQFFSSAPDANILNNSVISSGGGNSPAFGLHASGGTKSIKATFTADATTQAFAITGTEPTYSAVVVGVNSVPEPSAAALIGLGMVSFLRRRRTA